jgi:hypothetical protein
MSHHDVKIAEEFFPYSLLGIKPFEIRLNDRNYQRGDTICLHEWDEADGFSGRSITYRIGFITSYEQKPNWVVFACLPIE